MLQQIIDIGTRLVGARYGALGVFSESGDSVIRFITSGIDSAVREAIGPFPAGKGIIGLLARDPRPLRIGDMGEDPRSAGFPEGNPPMTSFLSVPLLSRGKIHGNLYFTDKQGMREFSAEDEKIAQSFASLSVAAIERESAFHVARESESRYWEILENLLLISVGLDLQGKITFCNDFLLQRTGWSREEILGRDWFEIFLPPETRDEVHDLYLKMIAGGGWRPHHLNEIVTREGARRLISWNNTVLRDPEGNVIGTISIGEDITARKMAEEQLHQSEKIEALGRLSSGVSHDFNNSLGIIHGSADVFERLLGKDTDAHILDYIDIIQKFAMSAAQTVKRLQDFSRKREDRPVGVADLNVVIREVAEMTSPRWKSEAEAEGVPFEFIVRPLAKRPLVPGVEAELHEILINLINNSLDAMPEGGRLFVTTEDTREGPRVSVKDNGAGMTPEVKARAFEPFFSTKGE
jgi:PAS domain S-box-containing protein